MYSFHYGHLDKWGMTERRQEQTGDPSVGSRSFSAIGLIDVAEITLPNTAHELKSSTVLYWTTRISRRGDTTLVRLLIY